MAGLELDHIVIAARSLGEGADYIRKMLDVEIPQGGSHPLMATHNCLMRLGESAFLEVIAIDPAAPKPMRPRWYALDDPNMQKSLKMGPRIVAWVLRSKHIDADAQIAGYQPNEIIRVSRGTLRWRLTVPDNGHLPWGGAFPHIIEWDNRSKSWEHMAELNCKLASLVLFHPDIDQFSQALDKLLPHWPAYLCIERSNVAGLSAEIEASGKLVRL